jgi:hypothetical protein
MNLFKSPFTAEHRVHRKIVKRREKQDSRYLVEPKLTVQELIATTKLFGVPVWRRVVDREEAPAWAVIESGCFGETSWRSKFAPHSAA